MATSRKKVKDNNFIQIQGWMLDLGLSGNELITYALIYGFSQEQEDQYFSASISFIMEWLQVSSKTTVVNILKRLVESGLIKKESKVINHIKFNKYSAVVPENVTVVQKMVRGSTENVPNNNIDNNIDSSSNSPIINNSPITPTNTPFIPQGGKQNNKYVLDLSAVRPEFAPVVLKWLTYKKERGQAYKQMGFNSFYKKLIDLSNGDPHTAMLIVEQSMANNYQGIFELKGGNNGNTTSRPTDAQVLRAAIDQSWGPGGDPLADIL